MKTMLKKYIVLLLGMIVLLTTFTACGLFKTEEAKNRRMNMKLETDAILYERPDGQSQQVGIMQADRKVEYISTKKIDGVKWYETEEGWFSVFMPSDHNGRVVNSAVARDVVELYSGASASAAVVGSVDAGTFLEIHQLRDLWGETANGWVLMENLYIPGHPGENTGWCLTLQDAVGCFSTPGAAGVKVKDYRSLYRLKFYETIEIGNVSWGYTDSGWIDMADVYIEGDIGTGACHVQVVDTTPLNVRVGPGTGYDIVRTLAIGSYTDVLFQVGTDNNVWGFMGDGWIYMGLVKPVEE